MCQEFLAIKQQIWQLNNGVDVFVGPANGCEHTFWNAVAFDKPVMSFVSHLYLIFLYETCRSLVIVFSKVNYKFTRNLETN